MVLLIALLVLALIFGVGGLVQGALWAILIGVALLVAAGFGFRSFSGRHAA